MNDLPEILKNIMPQSIRAEFADDGERWQAQGANVWFSDDESVEYIRADVVDRKAEALLNKQLATLDELKRLRAVAAAQLAERDAKLKAIETIVHRWIDSKDRNLDNGGSMIKIIEVLYPPHTKTTEQAS